MSTTKTTTNQYAPGGLQQYQSFMNTYGPMLLQWATNPFNNSAYRLNLSQNMAQANQGSMNAIQNAMSNFNMAGMGGAPSGARAQLMSQLGRYGTSLGSNAFLSAANNAVNRQNQAVNTMVGWQPMQTGQKQTVGGLGTWLPQVIGAGVKVATGLAGGGGMGGAMSNMTSGQIQQGIQTMGNTSPFFASSGFFSPNYGSAGMAPQIAAGNMGTPSVFGYLPQMMMPGS